MNIEEEYLMNRRKKRLTRFSKSFDDYESAYIYLDSAAFQMHEQGFSEKEVNNCLERF